MNWNKLVQYFSRLSPVSKSLLFFAFVAMFLVFLGYRMVAENGPGPCSPTGFPARCYHVSQKMCDGIWKNSEITCKDFIKNLNLPAGRLVGPILAKCQLVRLDEIFGSSRKSTPECNDHFSELEDWKRRNDFK